MDLFLQVNRHGGVFLSIIAFVFNSDFMANKSFTIFYKDAPPQVEDGDTLMLEAGKSHIALLHKKNNSGSIAGFELFTFSENEASSAVRLLSAIANTSQLLNHRFDNVNIYINDEFCVPVPADKFEVNLADDFLKIVFGTIEKRSVHYNRIDAKPGIVNVFSLSQEMLEVLNDRFGNFKIFHSWTCVLNRLESRNYLTSVQLIYVQFYNTHFITAIIKNGKLQMIQAFIYENPEDVLYQLLNICTQFELTTNDVQLEVCGLIDPNYKLFRELTNYFKNIVADKADINHLLINVDEYPPHYFTPFFNLGL